MKNHSKSIRASFQNVFDRHAPASKHVVRMKNLFVIQIDIRERVQSLKNQVDMFARGRRSIHINPGSVLPIGKADPLQSRVVVLVKRIGYQTVVQQVGLDDPGHARWMPFLDVRSGGSAEGAELPFRVNGARRGRLPGGL
jgi:hypothetical protein